MKDFSYAAPADLAAATTRLAQANGDAKLLAGGIGILVQLGSRQRRADCRVSVGGKTIERARIARCVPNHVRMIRQTVENMGKR